MNPVDTKGKYLRHKNALAFLDPIVSLLDSQDARFKKVKGLVDPKAVSFESVNCPGHYLRHRNGRVMVTECPGEGDGKDATFYIVKGLALDGDGWISLKLFTNPGEFVRNKQGEVWTAEKKDNEVYLRSATFRLVKPVPKLR